MKGRTRILFAAILKGDASLPVIALILVVFNWPFPARQTRAVAIGIRPNGVLLDPGIGFGKTLDQNLQLLAGLRSFTKLKRPLLLGVSRKSFIEKISGAKLNERLPASLACASLAIADGVLV